MESILLSVKPEYVERIFAGTKLYEYRKRLPRKNINKIVVYSTHPMMKIIGEVKVVGIISASPYRLWEETKTNSGISRGKFRKYFKGCKTAFAYKLGDLTIFDNPKTLGDYNLNHAPQSFVYIKE